MKHIASAIMLILCLGAVGLAQNTGPEPAADAAKVAALPANGKVLTVEDFRKILLNNNWQWAHPGATRTMVMRFLPNAIFAVDAKDVGRWNIVDTRHVLIKHPEGNFSSRLEFSADYTVITVTQTRSRIYKFDCPIIAK